MKIKHIWSVLCRESVINQDDNVISILGVLEEIGVEIKSTDKEKLPEKLAVPINYEIVSLWYREKKDSIVKADLEFSLLGPNKNILSENQQPIEMTAGISRFRSRVKIAGFPLEGEGDYNFLVKIKEEGSKEFRLVAEIPLEVKIKKTANT